MAFLPPAFAARTPALRDLLQARRTARRGTPSSLTVVLFEAVFGMGRELRAPLVAAVCDGVGVHQIWVSYAGLPPVFR